MGVARLRGLLSAGFAACLVAGCAGQHSEFAGPSAPGVSPVDRSQKSGNNEQVVYNFTGGSDGGNAATALVLDKTGNVYGTTVVGGTYQCGTIFEAKPQSGPSWTETPLYSFTCYGDGKNPHGGVTFDAKGNLDGTTVAGGTGYCAGDGCGVVFQYSSGSEIVLHAFTGDKDGFGPGGQVTLDRPEAFTEPRRTAENSGLERFTALRKPGSRGKSASCTRSPANATARREVSAPCYGMHRAICTALPRTAVPWVTERLFAWCPRTAESRS